jgi:hypothetical protein
VTERFFTADEANDLLATVRAHVERMVECRRALARTLAQRSRVSSIVSGNGGGLHPQAVARLEEEAASAADGVRRAVEALQELGVAVKDLDRGLVDFPALRDGEEVLLCWQLGEEKVGYWHGVDEGFAGRRELPL